MIITTIVTIIAIVLMILSILIFPKLRIGKITMDTFWIFPFFAAIIIVCSGSLSYSKVIDGLSSNNGMNPLKILVLFFSMALISIILDELGFFKFLAIKVLGKAKSKQITLFVSLYIMTSILTIFTSNDIIILTFTPFIIFFCKNAKIKALPYLICEFVSANTWSMFLLIGNPTNIYIASSLNISFFHYIKEMILPTVFGGITSLSILYLVFRKSLKAPMQETSCEEISLKNKPLLFITIAILATTTILLAISSLIDIEMYLVSAIGALFLILTLIVSKLFYKESLAVLGNSLKSLPYKLIPFVISMFIITLALKEYDICKEIATVLDKGDTIFTYGVTSFFSSNLINNIPMSVMFSNIIEDSALTSNEGAIFATIIGSNLGAIITPIGALAGIMWLGLLKKNEVNCSFTSFIKYGTMISIPTLLVTLLVLEIII